MATKTEDKQISALYWECIEAFRRLFKHIQEHGVNDKKVDIPRKLTGAPGQLQVWAENVGAHRRNSKLSLDYKLREASRYRAHVKVLLVDLKVVLAEALGLLTGELKPPQKNNDPESSEQDATDTDPDSSDDEPEEDVITATADEVGHSISSLFRLTANIQNLASRDRMERIEKIDVSAFGPFDINHVRDKYGLGEDAQYLIERLGKANTKRRQLLKYNEQHHDKIAGRRKDDTGNPGNTDSTAGAEADHQDEKGKGVDLQDIVWFAEGDYSLGEGSTTMQTTVSTVHEGNVPGGFENHEPDDDARSDTGFSETSYATSAGSSFSSDKLRVPPPPNGYSDEPFQCPYCFKIVTNQGRNYISWQKHVFRDIRPYVCTFRNCSQATRLYSSRHEWFHHECEFHRLEWPCEHCQEVSSSSQSFKDHITKTHRHLLRTESMAVLVDRSERVVESKQPCPLCPETFTPKLLQRHLGQHMQQIALFILPGSLQEDEEDGDDDVEERNDEDIDDEDDGGSAASDEGSEQPGSKVDDGGESADLFSDSKNDSETVVSQEEFIKAVKSGDTETVRAALKQGHFDGNTIDKDSPHKYTVLMIAYSKRHEDIAHLLLDHKGILVNLQNTYGWTALMYACEFGLDSVVAKLLARDDIQVNLQDKDGWTALMLACSWGRDSIIAKLLARDDIDTRLKDRHGKTAYDWCGSSVSAELKEQLRPRG
ncbi:hypothetical protein BZA77DRAFT_297552 [Pyronema omphalodes]|nr:hypothetical protein BZA77DRAFT_298362 [Pyronema omphalodes]KAI5810786.1 hypothetical protein BZA77DRAFT_297552 [Pyronema omphalodes]